MENNSTQIIHREFENLQVVLIIKVFINFESVLGQYVEKLMNALVTKGMQQSFKFSNNNMGLICKFLDEVYSKKITE